MDAAEKKNILSLNEIQFGVAGYSSCNPGVHQMNYRNSRAE